MKVQARNASTTLQGYGFAYTGTLSYIIAPTEEVRVKLRATEVRDSRTKSVQKAHFWKLKKSTFN